MMKLLKTFIFYYFYIIIIYFRQNQLQFNRVCLEFKTFIILFKYLMICQGQDFRVYFNK